MKVGLSDSYTTGCKAKFSIESASLDRMLTSTGFTMFTGWQHCRSRLFGNSGPFKLLMTVNLK